MNKKTLKRQRDLKTKLMAAISMLLVSSLMMVTSTYAWFTLSTAPEVTGITTAVGANGNLEMALLPVNGNTDGLADFGITSGTSDSMASQETFKANVTWGNLVDLTEYYGLEGVTLYPSQINANVTDGVATSIFKDAPMLKTPTYGADGRVSALNANTISGIYDHVQGKAFETVMNGDVEIKNPAGVRLLGTVSGMSDRQLDFRNTISMASAEAGKAQSAARGALEDNGNALGDIAVKYALDGNSAKFDDTDKTALVAMVTALLGDGTSMGALDYIEQGIRYYIYAYQMSVSADETAYLALKSQILGDGENNPSSLTELQDANLVPDEMDDMISQLATSRSNLNTAKTSLGQLTDGEYEWTELSSAMQYLVNIDNMSINGMPVSGDRDALKNKIMDDFLASKGITLTMPTGSGVFTDVADFAGNYGATIDVSASAVLEGSTATISASMVTAGKTPTYFDDAKAIATENPINAAEGASQAISDYYGYVIDLAFRTNAADSYLKLQTTAVDRIYSSEDGAATDENTMGGGATMIFKSTDSANGFQETEMQVLMKHIRIVFFDPTADNEILGYGVLDENTIELLGNYEVSVGLKMAKKPIPEAEDYIEDNKIMPLVQNEAHRLSVLVYLDGTTITNADVAIGSATSMTGSLNLQFSSSAVLEPMKYTDFESLDGSNSNSGESTNEPVITSVGVGSITENYSATIKHVSIGSINSLVAEISTTNGTVINADSGVTVTIDGANAGYATVNGVSGWQVVGTESVPEKVDITVTPNAG